MTDEDFDAPLDDSDITSSGSDPVPGGGDADGTDGGDADGTDGDGTRRHRRRRLGRRRHRRRRRRRHRRDRALSEPASALDLLSGDAQTFTSKVWASLVHVHETDPAALVAMLSLDDADELLTGTAIRTPAIRVAQDGSVLGETAYVRRAPRSPAGRCPVSSTRARPSTSSPAARPSSSRGCTATTRR